MDPRFKMQFVEWAYDKLYGPDSSQLEVFNDTLSSLFDAYVEKSFDPNDSNYSIDEDVFDLTLQDRSGEGESRN
ncbi:putative hAT-like transposase, RNase-H [Rosa chinensis]|uniref:Putative hAT-like transposase, RNase-H n=1 Tax=Rosa chinensis TaxID=74649 RepID=A0A2P6SBJ3_ROSCH|nr:putative hAT-like transposase, RNase-H [Rosa chinensis]